MTNSAQLEHGPWQANTGLVEWKGRELNLVRGLVLGSDSLEKKEGLDFYI